MGPIYPKSNNLNELSRRLQGDATNQIYATGLVVSDKTTFYVFYISAYVKHVDPGLAIFGTNAIN